MYDLFNDSYEKKLTAFCNVHGSYKYSPNDSHARCNSCINELSIRKVEQSIYDDCQDLNARFVKSGVDSDLHHLNVFNLNRNLSITDKQSQYLINYVENFDKNTAKNLVICASDFKTLNKISAGITLSLINESVNVTYEKNFDFFRKLRESNDYKSDCYVNFKRLYKNSDLLVVDNFSPKTMTEFQSQELYSVINNRYGSLLPTVFLTTFSIQQFFSFVGEKIEERISSNYDFMCI